MIQVTFQETIYLGACASSKYGIGNQLRGLEYRKNEKLNCFEILMLDGVEWVPVLSVVKLNPVSSTITWID